MVSLPRLFQAATAHEGAPVPPSPSIRSADPNKTVTNMTAQGGSSPTALGIPGSLKAIFGASDAHNPTATDEYVDEILPEYLPGSLLSSNATISRRSRLDDSAGEGLRRNVLVRNAMLSSLERERRQMSQEILDYYTVPSSPTEGASSTAVALDEEAQFFEDLLSELSGGDGFNAASSELPPTGPSPLGLCPIKDDAKLPTDEEDFVKLDSDLPSEPVLAQLVSSSYQAAPREAAPEGSQLRAKVVDRSALTLVDSCVASCSETPGSDESSFAEATSRLIPASSCCSGYPNVCPYPATSSSVGGSSEELPALVDDNDSDLDEDEDEDEVEDQVQDRHEGEVVRATENIAAGSEGCAMLNANGDGTLSRPLSPLLSPVHSVYADYNAFRDPLSPEPSRPTSPMSSASSKGDGDATSPLLLPSDIGPLPSLAELSLQLPAAAGVDLLARPRALAGAWFDNKLDTPAASSSADRMRWTTSPATYFRSTAVASSSSSTLASHHPPRFGIDYTRSNYPSTTAEDSTEHSVVVHWSR